MEQMTALKQTIRTLTASLEKLEKEQRAAPVAAPPPAGDASAKQLAQLQQQHEQTVRQLEATAREAQQRAQAAEQAVAVVLSGPCARPPGRPPVSLAGI